MFHAFRSESADDAWLQVAALFRQPDLRVERQSRAGPTLDLGRVAIELTDATQRWVVSRRPSINPAFAIAEVVWIMTGRNDAAFLNYFNRQLPNYAGVGATYSGAYGYRLRRHAGLDQLDRAHSALQNCEMSRQVVLQIWDAQADLPGHDGTPASPDVPCNVVSLLKLRDGFLDWTQVMRSNDLFRGLPHNLVQFTTLQEVMAGWLGVLPGSFCLLADSMHVYAVDFESIETAAVPNSQAARNTDSMAFSRIESERYFAELAESIELIIDESSSAEHLERLVERGTLPKPFEHMRHILVAEGLRRRSCTVAAQNVISRCNNPAYRLLWESWLERLRLRTPQHV